MLSSVVRLQGVCVSRIGSAGAPSEVLSGHVRDTWRISFDQGGGASRRSPTYVSTVDTTASLTARVA